MTRMPRRTWTAHEIAELRRRYPHERAADIAADLGRGIGSIYQAAAYHGISKSNRFYASDRSGRIARGKRDPRMQATQFRPGNRPWNKGKPFHAGGRSVETQFKPGCRRGAAQHNYRPIGSLRVTRDGSLERKVTDDPSIVPTQRWVAVARLVWEAEHGPIPPKHVVRFRDGQHTTEESAITVDKLECISMAENMRRNTYHRYPQPIPQLIQLRGALTRKINNRSKKDEERN